MFGVSLLIIIASALLGTVLTAAGLRLFFHLVEPSRSAVPIPTSENRSLGE